jgi:hypothetical protein
VLRLLLVLLVLLLLLPWPPQCSSSSSSSSWSPGVQQGMVLLPSAAAGAAPQGLSQWCSSSSQHSW